MEPSSKNKQTRKRLTLAEKLAKLRDHEAAIKKERESLKAALHEKLLQLMISAYDIETHSFDQKHVPEIESLIETVKELP